MKITETPLLEIIAIPYGDNPQAACMRINIQIYAPDDLTEANAAHEAAEMVSADAAKIQSANL